MLKQYWRGVYTEAVRVDRAMSTMLTMLTCRPRRFGLLADLLNTQF